MNNTHKPLPIKFMIALTLVLVSLGTFSSQADPGVPPLLHSYAKPEVQVRHIKLDLTVDFERHTLSGTASLQLVRGQKDAKQLYLDSKGLLIRDVALGPKRITTSYAQGPWDADFGRALIIDLLPDTEWVHIDYQTQASAEGLQWLAKEMTQGKRQPFLYSQGQTVFTRSWIPCQDDPAFRVTYDAVIHVPAGVVALMGAEHKGFKTGADGKRSYQFAMRQPIPTYLIALAVGDVAFKSIGKNIGVYAEPELVEQAAKEFIDTRKMMAAAEKRYGKYRWGRYDILVLPPAFPYGGMENPRLTFVNPTIIAGDGSLVNTVAHELAHSWSGNLVTNGTWEDFWLNEGATTYIQRRILEDVYGKTMADLDTMAGYHKMEMALAELPDYGKSLKTRLEGKSPEHIFSALPYEKGSLFFQTIEQAVGRAAFDRFLRKYFNAFAFQTMTTEAFATYLAAEFSKTHPQLSQNIDFNQWFYQTNIPANAVKVSSELLDQVTSKQQAWIKGELSTQDLQAQGWSWVEWVYFLKGLNKVQSEALKNLDEAYQLSATQNAEISCEWFLAALRNNYRSAEVRESLEKFLVRVGRGKFTKPLYQALKQKDIRWARAIYAQARPGYHVLSQQYFDKLLK